MNKCVNVAVVGLGFGAEFIPIYKDYKLTACTAVCQRSQNKLNETADQYEIGKRYTDYEELLKDPEIDAVHINTGIADHAPMAKKALLAGKHVACTVPMAISVEDCLEIAALEEKTGLVYMMMETSVYTREYLYAKELRDSGKLGEIQFLRGSHQQNMGLPGWPSYWYGLPPMYYATHAVGPVAALAGRPIDTVRCYGSGRIREEYIGQYQSPFAVESAQLKFEDSGVRAEVTRSLFDTIRQYRESFDVYGTKASFEWEQLQGENPVLYTGCEDARRIRVPDTDGCLPPEIAKYSLRGQVQDKEHVSYIQGAGHGGSHPHLVREFISAVLEGRASEINAKVAANWTMAGILSHESAMNDGEERKLPRLV